MAVSVIPGLLFDLASEVKFAEHVADIAMVVEVAVLTLMVYVVVKCDMTEV